MRNYFDKWSRKKIVTILLVVVIVGTWGYMLFFSDSSTSQVKEVKVPVLLDPAMASKRSQFDSKIGNNAEAVSTVRPLIQSTKGTGVLMYLRLDSSPESETNFTNGGDLSLYRSSVTGVQLSVLIDGQVWGLLSDDVKKNMVATFVSVLHTLYSNAYQEVDVSNSVRPIAKGTWSAGDNGPSVELK